MGFPEMLLLSVIIFGLLSVLSAAPEAKPVCLSSCGDVDIPYPFGTDISCSLNEQFLLQCKNSQLISGHVQLTNISFETHELNIMLSVSTACFDSSGTLLRHQPSGLLSMSSFTVSSTRNKFIAVGCDTYGYLNSFQNGQNYSTGCLSRCFSKPTIWDDQNSCLGIGCCQVNIPIDMKNITIEAFSFNSHRGVSTFNNCSYAFVAQEGSFKFSDKYLPGLPSMTFPVVIDWTTGSDTCEDARKIGSLVCQENSHCSDSEYGTGDRCLCDKGYEGNPYASGGCHDIDECKSSISACPESKICRNIIGSHVCECPKRQLDKEGDCVCPRGQIKDGTNCLCLEGQSEDGRDHNGMLKCKNSYLVTIITIGVGVGFVAFFVCLSGFYLVLKQRKLIKLKEKFFQQNGGYILQQQLSSQKKCSTMAKIFTAMELEKATNKYDEDLVIGKGGFSTVYKGFLSNNTIVAIKKSKIVNQGQIEQFINEVVMLSQINHRNMVKLLGCCLETEVPLLVYEFINNGTLHNYIHDESKLFKLSWETRLRIASETAGALAYLHSLTSIPIIHRDVKPTNILLDENLTPKVADFGASRLVPFDKSELATMVQGTLGYLDPEYMQTSQLTEKSDVYSFGVILVELLTGRKAISCDRPEEERSLSMYFLTSRKQDRLLEIMEKKLMNKGNKKMIEDVAILATKCLKVNGDERPSMKEVALELEGMRMTEKHPWVSIDLNLNPEEVESMLEHETNMVYEYGENSVETIGYDSMIKSVPLVELDDGR